MKYLLPLLLLFSLEASSQCDPKIPMNSIVYDSITPNLQVYAGSGFHVWICSGIQVDIEQGYNTIYIEDSSFLTSLSTLHWADPHFNTVYIKQPGEITIGGDSNTIYFEKGVKVKDNGSGNMTVECPTMTFDYSEAPDSKCKPTATTSIRELNEKEGIEIFPNPSSGQFNITSPSPIIQISIHSSMGELVYHQKFNGQNTFLFSAPMSHVDGLYFISIQTDNGIETKKLILKRE
jgi:hypothetical protein